MQSYDHDCTLKQAYVYCMYLCIFSIFSFQVVNLLDSRRSMNINIFIRQFRSSNEEIIEMIKDGEHDDIGAEKLKGLMKILPEMDEIEMLKSYPGDKSKLGNAERFILQLVAVSK